MKTYFEIIRLRELLNGGKSVKSRLVRLLPLTPPPISSHVPSLAF